MAAATQVQELGGRIVAEVERAVHGKHVETVRALEFYWLLLNEPPVTVAPDLD